MAASGAAVAPTAAAPAPLAAAVPAGGPGAATAGTSTSAGGVDISALAAAMQAALAGAGAGAASGQQASAFGAGQPMFNFGGLGSGMGMGAGFGMGAGAGGSGLTGAPAGVDPQVWQSMVMAMGPQAARSYVRGLNRRARAAQTTALPHVLDSEVLSRLVREDPALRDSLLAHLPPGQQDLTNLLEILRSPQLRQAAMSLTGAMEGPENTQSIFASYGLQLSDAQGKVARTGDRVGGLLAAIQAKVDREKAAGSSAAGSTGGAAGGPAPAAGPEAASQGTTGQGNTTTAGSGAAASGAVSSKDKDEKMG